jgi:2,4-dienoyl-CoA reductase-like NADH-dependent reductase (Old Yellow Enzyme family)/pyruvate/2-oxoglutarate dehydrogenase complex dihydrolipoamide dehydrogenase (E3) component
MFSKLFTPIQIGNMVVRNRIVMPPMHMGYGSMDGTITEKYRDYYGARAKGGTGLIITEACAVHPERKYGLCPLGLYDDALIPSWKELAHTVHEHGGKLAAQLMDPGPESMKILTGTDPVGPSPIAGRSYFRAIPKELSSGEIEAIVEDFGHAVRRAKEAGLDAVEIHAAHGYALVGSFMSPFFNKRTDAYGGSLERRAKILLDIIRSAKDKVGPDFPLIVRIAGDERRTGGRTLGESQFVASMLEDAGVAAIEVSGGTVPTVFWAVVAPSGTPLALNADYAHGIKEVIDIPVISVGRINTPRVAEFVIKSGKTDMVSMGRALHADPDMPNKAAAGELEDIAPCIACNIGCIGTVTTGQPATCIVNPAAGKEREMAIAPVKKPKKVLVAGGGPAGLEAARVAALRGHEVTLCEKSNKLGGQINIASVPPFMQEISQLIQYLSVQVEKAGVQVELGKEVTSELIDELKPDALIIATGAEPLIPDALKGVDRDNVVTAWEVLAGHEAALASNVVIVGGGLVGCETADFLAQTTDTLGVAPTHVTVLEMQDRLALDGNSEARHLLMERLAEKRVDIRLNSKADEIVEGGVLFTKDGEEVSVQGAEYVILATGAKSVNNLSDLAKDRVAEVYVIGDARNPATALQATADAAWASREV